MFSSRGIQSLISWAPEHEPYFTTQAKTPKPQGLLPWFKCFSSSASCLALLYLLRLPGQSTASECRVRISLCSKLSCPDLQRLELLAPATAMTQHTTRAAGSSHSPACSWHQLSIKGSTNLFVSQRLKKRKKKFVLQPLFLQTYFCNWGPKLLFIPTTQGLKCYNGGVLVDWLSNIIRQMPTSIHLFNCKFKTGNKSLNTEIRTSAEKKRKNHQPWPSKIKIPRILLILLITA